MEVRFADGAHGYHEARELEAMVRFVIEHTVSGTHDQQLLDYLLAAADQHLARPEFEALRRAEPPPPDDRPWWERMVAGVRRLLGPGRHEQELARQRRQALERAQRAEQAAFEALAETARVARERDECRARLEALEAELARLRSGRTGD